MKKLTLLGLFLLFATVLARKTLRTSAYRIAADTTTTAPDSSFGDTLDDEDGLECEDDDDYMLA